MHPGGRSSSSTGWCARQLRDLIGYRRVVIEERGRDHSVCARLQIQTRTREASVALSGDYFEKRRNSTARQRRLVAQLEAMGHTVTLEPAA